MADDSSPPFRFYDNRQKYLAFVTTCNEKSAIARRATHEVSLLRPTPQGKFCKDKPRWRALETRKAKLALRLARQWQAHPARLSAEANRDTYRSAMPSG